MGRKRNIHNKWTISTVQCFSFSSTIGLVLADNNYWVEFGIFCLVLVLLCLIKMHFSTVTSIYAVLCLQTDMLNLKIEKLTSRKRSLCEKPKSVEQLM